MNMGPQSQLFVDFPELASLSREDLEDLLSNPAYFEAVFHSLSPVRALFQAQLEVGMANQSLANHNLEFQDDLYRLRSETQEAFDQAKRLQSRAKELEREQKELYQRYDPSFLLLRLRHATTAQDEHSESIASSFIRHSAATSTRSIPIPTPTSLETGTSTPIEKDIDDFVKEFREARKQFHKRKIWGDQWTVGKVVWNED
ncbi:uncharacterized protein EI90DRAFT_2562587 [Cantharellus anzutake]|uniref:uncharacterized protein n=1 Tax=Cantharellus anzutake TaxID=1750568 RepID=UPI001907441B|nr:uncharacterized protein EI90DRAFT_2562587 [Cantharellus anzutake]KAF8338234.1 hypothetical protein EI90DRAFT_2562587 [Cantharellus anzutake]